MKKLTVRRSWFRNTFASQLLDPYVYEEERQVVGNVSHINEAGKSENVPIYTTSILDRHPFQPKYQQFFFRTTKKKKTGDEEEDPVPENAFDMYYLECDSYESNEAVVLSKRRTSNADEFHQNMTRGWTTFSTVLSCDKESRKIRNIAVPATWSTVASSLIGAAGKFILCGCF